MALQYQNIVSFVIIGDGVSTVIKLRLDMDSYLVQTSSGEVLENWLKKHPISASPANVSAPFTVSLAGDGVTLTITYATAPANGTSNGAPVSLLFNGE